MMVNCCAYYVHVYGRLEWEIILRHGTVLNMVNASEETCSHNYFSRKEHVVFVIVNKGGCIVTH